MCQKIPCERLYLIGITPNKTHKLAKTMHRFIVGILSIGFVGQMACAQTLDEQYEYYLANKCKNLNFTRVTGGFLEEGQAEENLSKYCGGPQASIPLPPGSSITANSSGGASATRGADASQVLRNREKRNREKEAVPDDASHSTTLDVYSAENLGLFFTYNSRREERDVTTYEAGNRAEAFDVLLGADYRVGERAVLGAAYSLARVKGDFFGGGDFEKSSQAVWLFGAWLPLDNASIDFSVGLDDGKHDTRRNVGRHLVLVTPADAVAVPEGQEPVYADDITTIIIDIPYVRTQSRSHSRSLNVTVNGGYDFNWSAFTVGPRAGVAQRKTTMDSFDESGETPMTLQFDQQVEKSVISTLGVQGSRAFGASFGVINFQFNMDWLHEWSDKQRLLTATFAEDLRPDAPRLAFLNEAPDQNWLRMRLGSVAVLPNGMSFFMALEQTFLHEYLEQKSVSLGLRKVF